MTYEDFKKSLNTFFKPYGFRRHSTHFHCEASDGVMVVFGVYKSVYDTDLCYMEYGYAFKEICEQWPYPRVNYLHLNCGRIHLPNRNNIHLSAVDDEEFKQFCELLESLVKPALEVARLGLQRMWRLSIQRKMHVGKELEEALRRTLQKANRFKIV